MIATGLLDRVLKAAVKPPYLRLRRALGRLLFERRYGVQTEGRLGASELGLHDPHLIGYSPSRWLSLRRILPSSEVGPNDVFLDVGSGMGRVVLQAALYYPFRRVMGIEISARLHEIALTNLATNTARLRCQHVELQNANVLDLEIPDDVTIVYLFNPFTGQTFQEFIDLLLRSANRNPRPIRLIYTNPQEEAKLVATGCFRPVRTREGTRLIAACSASDSTRMYTVYPLGSAGRSI